MKQILLIILLFLSLSRMIIFGQTIEVNENQLKSFKKIPQETIYIHFNTTLLFTGEYIYYTVYCLNANSNYFSDLSKIAYVELISKKGEIIFKHKIKLEAGLGNGDFFIPATVPSGSYKLVGYTSWMQNGEVSSFFQNDIHIINPYLADQSAVQTSKNDTIDLIGQEPAPAKEILSNAIVKRSDTVQYLQLELEKKRFKKRSKVIISLKSTSSMIASHGVYSISVRKKGTIPEPIKLSADYYIGNYKSKNYILNDPKIYLPELRGELIRGTVTAINNTSVKDLKVAVSIPGENYYFGIAKTNQNGHFYLNITNYYSGNEAIFQVLGDYRQEFKISLDKHTSSIYKEISFKDLKIDPSMKKEILNRSIHNQIENVYFQYKPDSTLSLISRQLFDDKIKQTYVLDDFTRFKTVKETIFEIVKDVFIRRVGKDRSVIQVQVNNFNSNNWILPLVLVDGLLIQNFDFLLNSEAKSIDEIVVFRDRFIIGPQVFQGAIFIKTLNGFEEDLKNDGMTSSILFKPQIIKKYFKQQYSTNNDNSNARIPDDRIQLLWIPKLNLTEKHMTLDFFTSDVSGEYEINIEGFSQQHRPISIRKSIYVD